MRVELRRKTSTATRRFLGMIGLAALQSCDVLSPKADLEGTVFFTGVPPGTLSTGTIAVPGATIRAQGQVVYSSAAGTFSLSGLDPGDVALVVSAGGFADKTVSVTVDGGANNVEIELTPTPEVVVGTTSILMSAPGVAATSLSFPFPLGVLSSDPMPTFTTTGPFSALRGGNDYRARSVVISSSEPGTGSVTVTHGTHSATIQVESVNLKFKTINIGTGSACGIALDDTAWCWGANYLGQVGASTPYQCNGAACQYGGRDGAPTPLPVAERKQFAQVATTGFACANFGPTQTCGTSCALTFEGQPWCWGGTPKAMATVSLKRLTLRALGPNGSGLGNSLCGLDTAGKAMCFSSTTVTPDGGGMTFQSYSVGRLHSCGVDLAGDVYCWGGNTRGELGIGTTDSDAHSIPFKVTTSDKFTEVSAGESSTCALATTGTIYCWGLGYSPAGESPPPACSGTIVCQTSPRAITGSGAYVAMARGQSSDACGLTVSGAVDCWTSFNVPPARPTLPPLAMISVGRGTPPGGGNGLPYDACGLTADGVAYCWRGTSVTKIAQP